MFRAISLVLIVFLFVSCTKKVEKPKIPSAFNMEFSQKLISGDVIATYGDQEITRKQLFSPSPALRDLFFRIQKLILQRAADVASEQSVSVMTVGFELTEELKAAQDLPEGLSVKTDLSFGLEKVRIGPEEVTTDALSASDRLLSQLRTQFFKQQVRSIEGLVSRRWVLMASKKSGETMEAYIQGQVLGSGFSVSKDRVESFVKKNKIPWEQLSEEEQQKIVDAVKGQQREKVMTEFVANKMNEELVQIGFNQPQVKMSLPKGQGHSLTLGEGPIGLTVFANLRCEGCVEAFKYAYEKAAKEPKVYSFNFVFSFDEGDNEERMLSEAATCLSKDSPSNFWLFLNRFEQQGDLEQDIYTTVESLGLEKEEFRGCFLAREFKEAVERQRKLRQAMGFNRLPMAIVDGQVLEPSEVSSIGALAQQAKVDKGMTGFWYRLKSWFFG